MTAGIAFEAMMDAGHLNNNLKIILNDNDMSISKNKGGFQIILQKYGLQNHIKCLNPVVKKFSKIYLMDFILHETLKMD